MNHNTEKQVLAVTELYVVVDGQAPAAIIYAPSFSVADRQAKHLEPHPCLPELVTTDDINWVEKFSNLQKVNNYKILQPITSINDLFSAGVSAAWFLKSCVILLH